MLKIIILVTCIWFFKAKAIEGNERSSNIPHTVAQSAMKAKLKRKIVEKIMDKPKDRKLNTVGNSIRNILMTAGTMAFTGYPINYMMRPGRSDKKRMKAMYYELKKLIRRRDDQLRTNITKWKAFDDNTDKLEEELNNFVIDFSNTLALVNATIESGNMKQVQAIKDYIANQH